MGAGAWSRGRTGERGSASLAATCPLPLGRRKAAVVRMRCKPVSCPPYSECHQPCPLPRTHPLAPPSLRLTPCWSSPSNPAPKCCAACLILDRKDDAIQQLQGAQALPPGEVASAAEGQAGTFASYTVQADHSQVVAAHELITTGSCNECGVVQPLTNCAPMCSCTLSCMGRHLNSPCRSTVRTQPAAPRCSTLGLDGCAVRAPDCRADVQRQLVPCFSAFEITDHMDLVLVSMRQIGRRELECLFRLCLHLQTTTET